MDASPVRPAPCAAPCACRSLPLSCHSRIGDHGERAAATSRAIRSPRRSPCPAPPCVALPPRSGVRGADAVGEHALDRRARSRAAASAWPRKSSISAPDQIWPIGLAMPLPAMSGAEPCTGSNSDGNVALGIDVGRRRDADRAAHRGTEVGQDVAEQVRADDDVEAAPAAARSARVRMSMWILVGADVRILRRHRAEALVPVRHRDRDAVRLGRRRDVLRRAACARARTRSAGCGRRPCARTPTPGTRSRARCPRTCGRRPTSTRLRCSRARRRSRCRRACGSASGDGMPGISRHGRRLTYWSKRRRNWISEPHSDTWSGTVAGQPTAP